MPILNKKPEIGDMTPLVTPADPGETMNVIVADNKDMPLAGMRAYVDGKPWTIETYFRQLVASDNDLREIDPDQSVAYQQYEAINNLMLRVETDLSTGYNNTNHITSVTGSAMISYLNPNSLDYFVAEAGIREKGIFKITNIERRTFNVNSVYRIEYELVGYVSQRPEIYEALKARVVRELFYSHERLSEGLPPILTSKVHHQTVDLSKSYLEMAQYHSERFFNYTNLALVIPGQDLAFYDPWLVDFITRTVSYEHGRNYADMKKFAIDQDRYLSQPNIFSILTEGGLNKFSYMHKKIKLVARNRFNTTPFLKGPLFWDIDCYVYPLDGNTQTNTGRDPLPVSTSDAVLKLSSPSMESLPMIPNNTSNLPSGGVIIKSAFVDGYYVFSSDFYNDGTNLSSLEILVRDYLKGESIDIDRLGEIVSKFYTWPVLEQFYYGPVIMMLIKVAVKGMF